MSNVTTTPLVSFPSNAVNVSIPNNTSAWVWGAWVEVVAAADITAAFQLAGITLNSPDSYSTTEVEIGLGVGASGSEVSVSVIRLYLPNSGNGGPTAVMMPLALDVFPAGSRISARMRRNANTAGNILSIAVMGYFGFNGERVSSAPLTCFPLGADGVTFTPAAVAWTNTSWQEVVAATAVDFSLVAATFSNRNADEDVEIDIGIGGSGSETVLTTLRSASIGQSLGRLWFIPFPALMPIAVGTRISFRMRKSGTGTNQERLALLGYFITLSNVTPVTAILKVDDDALDDDGELFQAYVTSPAIPGDALSQLAQTREPVLMAKQSEDVTIQLTVIRDLGIQEQTSRVDLTPVGNESHVFRKFNDSGMADSIVQQFKLGDAAAVQSSWSLDRLSVKAEEEGES